MSSLPSSHVSIGDPVADGTEPSFGNALERVYGAGQALIVRRIDLLVEELAAQGRSLLAASVGTIFGAVAVLVGWFFVVAGVVDAIDDYVPRFAVEIVVGILHVGVGTAIAIAGRQRVAEKAST
jgi:Putative Actinobacterial Holin-X, holin superfamily III